MSENDSSEIIGNKRKRVYHSKSNENKSKQKIISKKYKLGKLRRIKKLNYFPLEKVLTTKYNFKEKEAKALSDFLMPMLEYYPYKRATARELLRHPWLSMPADFDYKISDIEIEKKKMIEDNKIIEKDDVDDTNIDMRDVYSSDRENESNGNKK